jgi:hypothetical protein
MIGTVLLRLAKGGRAEVTLDDSVYGPVVDADTREGVLVYGVSLASDSRGVRGGVEVVMEVCSLIELPLLIIAAIPTVARGASTRPWKSLSCRV